MKWETKSQLNLILHNNEKVIWYFFGQCHMSILWSYEI